LAKVEKYLVKVGELSKALTTSLIQGLPELKSILKESESQLIIFRVMEKSNHRMEVITTQCHQEEALDLDQVTVIQIQELEAILFLTRVLRVDLKMVVFF
jgi:hypothetical protein